MIKKKDDENHEKKGFEFQMSFSSCVLLACFFASLLLVCV